MRISVHCKADNILRVYDIPSISQVQHNAYLRNCLNLDLVKGLSREEIEFLTNGTEIVGRQDHNSKKVVITSTPKSAGDDYVFKQAFDNSINNLNNMFSSLKISIDNTKFQTNIGLIRLL